MLPTVIVESIIILSSLTHVTRMDPACKLSIKIVICRCVCNWPFGQSSVIVSLGSNI